MRGQEVILLNFPISHFLKSLAHSALIKKSDFSFFNSVFARQSSCLLPSQDSLELDFPPEKNFCRRSLLIGNTKKEPLERNCWED